MLYLTYTMGTGLGQLSGPLTEERAYERGSGMGPALRVGPLLGHSCAMSILRNISPVNFVFFFY